MRRRRRSLPFLLLLIAALGLGGCSRAPQPVTAAAANVQRADQHVDPPAFVALPAAQAIPQLIAAERAAARRGDLQLLAQLWAQEARIIDSRGTDDPADDFTWPSRAAILDRYTLAVFPAPPPALAALPTPRITVQGDRAQAVNGVDRWQFSYEAGRWWLTELRY